MHPSDEDLMVLVSGDDQQAFRCLVERHVNRMYGLVRRLLGNGADAEDVVQDVFLRLWTSRSRWNPDGARFSTWLYRVVINRCIDHRRRAPHASIEEAGDPIDGAPDAVSHIQRREVVQQLQQAIGALSEQQRIALTLFYYEGLSAAEAAEIMSLSQGALESLLKRARQRLREILRKAAVDAQHAFDDC